MTSTRRPRALAALLAVPALAVPATIAAGAATASAQPGPPAPCNHPAQAANPNGHAEALIANPSPAPGSSVPAGGTISFLYSDETPFGLSTSSVTNPTVLIDGTPVTSGVTVGPQTSGTAVTYVQPGDGGSTGTQCQNEISVTLPPSVGSGSHTITVTVYDGDNDHETVSWGFSVPGTVVPVGAIGGLAAGGVAGAGLVFAQLRRRRRVAPGTRAG